MGRDNSKNSAFIGGNLKTYQIGEKTFKLRPMSFFELLELPDIFTAILERSPGLEDDINAGDVVKTLMGKVRDLLSSHLTIDGQSIDVKEFRNFPTDTGMAMVADFMEENFSENFIKELQRAVMAGKKLFFTLSSSSDQTAIKQQILNATPSGK